MVQKVIGAVVVLLSLAGAARAEKFVILPGEGSSVRFESKAPMESFGGETSLITGTIEVNPADLSSPVAVSLEVDLASLDTGIKLRNKHMCEHHLETDKFPVATFVSSGLGKLGPDRLDPGVGVELELAGTFTLHGVSREVTIPVTVAFQSTEAGVSLRVISDFQIKLSDYGIARPQFLILKLDEVQRIHFDVTAFASPEQNG